MPLTQTKQAVFQWDKLDTALLPIWAGCQPGSCTPLGPHSLPRATTPASPAWPPAPLRHSCPGDSSPLNSPIEQTRVFRNPKCCLIVRETPPRHAPCNTRALRALEVCEEVSGEEQCSRRGAAAAAARCSKVSLKQEQSAQISPTAPKVSGSRYFGKACKK